MTSQTPVPSRLSASRIRTIRWGLLTLLLPTLAIAAWSLSAGLDAERQTRRSAVMSGAYAAAYGSALLAERAREPYSRTSREKAQRTFFQAVQRVSTDLQTAHRAGERLDRTEARILLTYNRRYRSGVTRWFRALDDGRGPQVRTIEEQDIQPVLARLLTRSAREADRHRDLTLESLAAQSRAGNVLVAAGPLSLLLAVGVLTLAGASRRRKRSERDLQQSELQRLEHMALTDNLTGLRNHRAFHEELTRRVDGRGAAGGWFSLLMVDLDGLKQTNDRYGHQAGDERIKALAESLRRSIRSTDCAYRVGGDEFTVVLPGERAWAAFEFAQRLRGLALERGAAVAVGVAESNGRDTKDGIIRRADLALIEAKRANRQTVIYSSALEPTASRRDEEAEEHHAKILATALARAVDAKDASTRNHCETVSELCALIGNELGLEPERIAKLRVAGLLHDVGKIGIADAILQKPAALDDEESDVMRTHAQIGHNIISAAELKEEARWVLHHHERVDGGGYPEGLAGEDLPLESRIIGVADTYEAITSDRPYRTGRTMDEALEELERNAGSQFDPVCVAALRRALAPATGITRPRSVPALPPEVVEAADPEDVPRLTVLAGGRAARGAA